MKTLSKTLQDYIEAVYVFERQNGFSRIKDIAGFLNVKLPAVNKAVKELSKRKLVRHERYGYVKLTHKGRRIASNLFNLHNNLVQIFKIFDIDDKKAHLYACYIEHIIEENDEISYLVEFFLSNPDLVKRIKRFIAKRRYDNS